MPAKLKKAKESKAKPIEKKENGVEPNVLHIVAQITDIIKGHQAKIATIEKQVERILSRMGL